VPEPGSVAGTVVRQDPDDGEVLGGEPASVKTAQLALGHSTPTVTLNEYVHEWPDVLDRTRSLVDGALGAYETAAPSAGSRS
jgi:hypothetical protein